jgi:predicted TIM-barrel fold metal-dependent hydrolase
VNVELELPTPGCCLAAPLARAGVSLPMAALHDVEGEQLPLGMPPVVDAHVHLFPDGVFEALWRFFDAHIWPVRYRLKTPQVLDFLFSRGVSRVVGLHYAHKPEMARSLNLYVAQLAIAEPRLLGLATVFPGEAGAGDILREAFDMGLKGVKLHCHVQCFAPDAPELHEIYEACAQAGKPLVMHSGREPKSAAYKVDPYQLCAVERVERVLRDHPRLKLCVPHLGADEFEGYRKLLERYENLWLDTTMMSSDYFPLEVPEGLFRARPERILYGTDFPNIPYAWDRELKRLVARRLGDEAQARLFGGNALALFEG